MYFYKTKISSANHSTTFFYISNEPQHPLFFLPACTPPTPGCKALNPFYLKTVSKTQAVAHHPINSIDFPVGRYIIHHILHHHRHHLSSIPFCEIRAFSFVSGWFVCSSSRIAVAGGWKNTAVTPPSDIQFPPRHRRARSS